MIKTFANKETAALFMDQQVRRIPPDIRDIARRKLLQLNRSSVIEDLRVPPGNRLERLKGKRAGQYSVRINDQWRLCFKFTKGDAFDVEIVDYH